MGCYNSKPDETPLVQQQTKLLYRSTWRVDGVNRLYGACRHGNTVVIIQPGRSPIKPYIRVPEGTYALVQYQGRDIDYTKPDGTRTPVWSPGMHFASLFTQISQLVTKQYIVFDTSVKGCKTADDVTVGIDMCLILRIMGDEAKGEDPGLVRRFVYELGPNGLEIQLRAAQDEAVRTLARSVEHTDVYQLRDVEDAEEKEGDQQGENTLYYVTEDIKRSLNDQFNTYGVQITSAAITNVTLPEEFQAQMENRTTHLSEIKEQKMKQLNDMQLLQYKEELATTKLKRDVMYMEEDQTAKAKCAEIRKGIGLIEAQTELADAETAQKTSVTCNNRDVEAELKIAEIEAETTRISAEITAHCDAEVGLINAEKAVLQMKLDAVADEIRARADAKADEIITRAEGAAAAKLEKYRKYKLEMKNLDKIGALSKNKRVVISGDTSNSLLSEVLVANYNKKIMFNFDGLSKSNNDEEEDLHHEDEEPSDIDGSC